MATVLSVIILTYEGEANLPAYQASIGGLEPESFVVDSGSIGRTVEIARAAGCRVVIVSQGVLWARYLPWGR